MKKFLRILGIIVVLAGTFLVILKTTTRFTPAQPTTSLANPASVYCQQQSGTLEIVTDASGAQSGLCHLPDGTTCEEWAYFRGECPSTGMIDTGTNEIISGGLMDQISQEVNNEQPSKSSNQSTTITKYENAKYVCGLKDGFYNDEANKINYYYGDVAQSAAIYKKNGFLYFLGRIPDLVNDGTQGIHLYKYDCQNSQTNDIHNFGGELYASAILNFASNGLLYIYEYYGDSCDSLFGNNSLYNIETNSFTGFDFVNFPGFKEKSGCDCTKDLDIKNGNEAYAICYCGNEGSCPEDDQEQYKVKIDILNKKIINNGW